VTRRELVRRGAAALGSAGVAAGVGGVQACGAQAPRPDALAARTLAELEVFTDWLSEHDVRGFVGEVGWPGRGRRDAVQWNALAQRWYERADAARLWVSNWAAGEWWSENYPLATYHSSRPQRRLDRAGPQAEVVEAHPSTDRYRRGVALAGGAFGFPSTARTSRYSNVTPGRVEFDYHYDRPASLRYLAGRGVDLLRVEFRWERLQPTLGGPLEPAELGRLAAVGGAAGAAGLSVVLDMHNYGAYYLHDGTQGVRRAVGSAEVGAGRFADVWERIAAAFRGARPVVALGLMNEPVGLAGPSARTAARGWEAASREAVAAIRATGERRRIAVSGYFYSGVQAWRRHHHAPWVDDPNVLYEAHHYWDPGHDSTYERTYARQARDLGRRAG